MNRVVLIKKNKPEWQKGKLNGVGGHIEDGEIPIESMVREFQEEAGLYIPKWDKICQIEDNDWIVHFFYARYQDIDQVKSKTDEEIQIIETYKLFNYPIIENLSWIIPLCIDKSIYKITITND